MTDAISPNTIDRLKIYAEPFVDTVDSVVNRLIDAFEANSSGPLKAAPSASSALDAASPPNLAFTTVHNVVLNGVRLPSSESKWNGLMIAAIQQAKKSMTTEEIDKLVIINHVLGKKTDIGYKYLADVGISVQGQDANHAWKATYEILKELKISAEIEFSWQNNPKASSPGARGKFVVKW